MSLSAAYATEKSSLGATLASVTRLTTIMMVVTLRQTLPFPALLDGALESPRGKSLELVYM